MEKVNEEVASQTKTKMKKVRVENLFYKDRDNMGDLTKALKKVRQNEPGNECVKVAKHHNT